MMKGSDPEEGSLIPEDIFLRGSCSLEEKGYDIFSKYANRLFKCKGVFQLVHIYLFKK